MRIAICFSGHLRNFSEIKQNLSENIEYLRRRGDIVDLFFSIWDTYEPEYSWTNQNGEKQVKIDINDVLSFTPVKIEIENYESIKNLFLLCNFTNKRCENNSIIKNGILYSTPMWYKIFRANSLKSEHEQKFNLKYDITVRYRANLWIIEDFNLKKTDCLTNKSTRNDSVYDDIFAYSSSSIMDIYSDLYNNLRLLFQKYDYFSPEALLATWVKENGIKRENVSFKVELKR